MYGSAVNFTAKVVYFWTFAQRCKRIMRSVVRREESISETSAGRRSFHAREAEASARGSVLSAH
jgi:hypothetical protein